jgi:hypothetical protein
MRWIDRTRRERDFDDREGRAYCVEFRLYRFHAVRLVQPSPRVEKQEIQKVDCAEAPKALVGVAGEKTK